MISCRPDSGRGAVFDRPIQRSCRIADTPTNSGVRLKGFFEKLPPRRQTAKGTLAVEAVKESTDVQFYFTTPYHSWEPGSNENFNGLLRQYLPKRTSQAGITQSDCDRIARKLNTRPRKRLGYRIPEECFHRF